MILCEGVDLFLTDIEDVGLELLSSFCLLLWGVINALLPQKISD